MDNKLKIHSCIFSVISKCVFKLKELPEFNSLRLKACVTHFVAGLVHELIDKSTLSKKEKKSIDQVKLIVQVIDEVYSLTEAEKNVVIDHIDHDEDNKLFKGSNFKKGLLYIGGILTYLGKS